MCQFQVYCGVNWLSWAVYKLTCHPVSSKRHKNSTLFCKTASIVHFLRGQSVQIMMMNASHLENNVFIIEPRKQIDLKNRRFIDK